MNKEIHETIEMLPRGTVAEIARVSGKSRQAIRNVFDGKTYDEVIIDAIISVCNRQALRKLLMQDQLRAVRDMLSKKEL